MYLVPKYLLLFISHTFEMVFRYIIYRVKKQIYEAIRSRTYPMSSDEAQRKKELWSFMYLGVTALCLLCAGSQYQKNNPDVLQKSLQRVHGELEGSNKVYSKTIRFGVKKPPQALEENENLSDNETLTV